MTSATHLLSEYCDENELTVNINKTKVIIFSCGKVRNIPQFRYKSNIIEVVVDLIRMCF